MDTPNTAETWLARGERWHCEHRELVDAWVEQVGGPTPWDLGYDAHRSAARELLRIPEARAEGTVPGEPQREPFVWDELDAYEVLFCHVVHGGPMGMAEPWEYLQLMGSFAAFLGEQGVIGLDEHAALRRDWPVWSQRLVEVWEEGGWYFADGTHRSPEGVDAHNREAADRHANGSRVGKHRRRTRPRRGR